MLRPASVGGVGGMRLFSPLQVLGRRSLQGHISPQRSLILRTQLQNNIYTRSSSTGLSSALFLPAVFENPNTYLAPVLTLYLSHRPTSRSESPFAPENHNLLASCLRRFPCRRSLRTRKFPPSPTDKSPQHGIAPNRRRVAFPLYTTRRGLPGDRTVHPRPPTCGEATARSRIHGIEAAPKNTREG